MEYNFAVKVSRKSTNVICSKGPFDTFLSSLSKFSLFVDIGAVFLPEDDLRCFERISMCGVGLTLFPLHQFSVDFLTDLIRF